MIEDVPLTKFYHVNDFALGLYCYNSIGIRSKYNIFKEKIIEFVPQDICYIEDYDYYTSYLLLDFLKRSFDEKVSINNFENKYFSLINAYVSKNFKGKVLENKNLDAATRWSNLLKINLKILEIVSENPPKSIVFNYRIFLPFNTNDFNSKRNSYFLTIPITLIYENHIEVIDIVFSEILNLHTLSLIKYFEYSLKVVHNFQFDIFTGFSTYSCLKLNKNLTQNYIKYYESLLVDSVPKLINCTTCIANKICTKQSLLKGHIPFKYIKTTKEIKNESKIFVYNQ